MKARIGLYRGIVAMLGLLSATQVAHSGSPAGLLTVCPAGPLACDYQTVQAGLDAAAPGDTVLIEPGTYAGSVTLKSEVILASSGGPDVTTLMADDGPLVSAIGVVSSALQGLSIRDQAPLTTALGIDLVDGELGLIDCTIRDLQEQDGVEGDPSGDPATVQAGERAYNLVAANLDAPGVVNADALAAYVGPGVYMVLRHDAATQSVERRLPGLAGTNFPVEVGDVYFLYLDDTASDVVSLAGDVPTIGAVRFDLMRPAPGGACTYNFISMPLHRDDLADADALAAGIGGVYSVSRYTATTQDLT
jgi:hypothetical protein